MARQNQPNKCANRYGEVLRPACSSSMATKRTTVVYHDNPFNDSGETSDTFDFCDACSESIKRDAERYGYKVRIKDL